MTETAAQCPAAALASTKARCGTWSLRAMKHVRLAAQLLALALLLAPLWWPLIFQAPSIYQGNIAASRLQLGPASIPMSDPFTTLCVLAGSRTVPVTLLAGAGLVLGFYLLVRGRTFCAYACPIHLVLELWDKLLVAFRIRREPIGEAGSRWLNVALAGLVLAASALAGLPAFEPVNPINTLIRSLQHLAFAGLWLVAAVMALEAVLGRRVFCRHLCPVGGFYSAINRAGVAGVAVDPASCTGCRQCTASCLAAPELIEAIARARQTRLRTPVDSPHCTVCFECAADCEHQGIVFSNRWRRSRPIANSR